MRYSNRVSRWMKLDMFCSIRDTNRWICVARTKAVNGPFINTYERGNFVCYGNRITRWVECDFGSPAWKAN